jgi:hypothetical protein
MGESRIGGMQTTQNEQKIGNQSQISNSVFKSGLQQGKTD